MPSTNGLHRPSIFPPLHLFIRTLAVDSVRELIRFKSFVLLVLFLIVLDRLLHSESVSLDFPSLFKNSDALSETLFVTLPRMLPDLLFSFQTWGVFFLLFLVKQLVSLWPSSDMRLMHRGERSGFALFRALLSLKLYQVAWDAAALGSLLFIVGLWCAGAWFVARMCWQITVTDHAAYGFMGACILPGPLIMAGLSYSSKLAVLSRGGFLERLLLYFYLFTNRRIFYGSYLFYLVRIILETVFVALIPAGLLLAIPWPFLRIAAAAVIAAPAYAFLKMASFKFFLEMYRAAPPVRAEYPAYYNVCP